MSVLEFLLSGLVASVPNCGADVYASVIESTKARIIRSEPLFAPDPPLRRAAIKVCVRVAFRISVDGRAVAPQVSVSSKHRPFDNAVRAALSKYIFVPPSANEIDKEWVLVFDGVVR